MDAFAPCYEFKTGSLLGLDEVDAVCFVEKGFSKEADPVVC